MSRRAFSRPPNRPPLEKVEQAHICAFVRATLQGKVWVLGTVRRRTDYQGTNQTPGLADLWMVLPAVRDLPSVGVWWETKSKAGQRSAAQVQFGEACQSAGVAYGFGPFDAFMAWAISQGRVLPSRLAHYHQRGV